MLTTAIGAFVLSAGHLYNTDDLQAGIVVLSLLALAVSWLICWIKEAVARLAITWSLIHVDGPALTETQAIDRFSLRATVVHAAIIAAL